MKTIEEIRQAAKQELLRIRFVAIDYNGYAYGYESRPEFSPLEGVWNATAGESFIGLPIELDSLTYDDAAEAIWTWEEFLA